MEVASAVGLAAAILQLATFSGQVLGRSRKLYKVADGALIQHSELSLVTAHLSGLLSNVHQRSTSMSLRELTEHARKTTQELLDLLNSLKQQAGPKQPWTSVRQALATIRKERELNELEERVARYRDELDTALIHELGEVMERPDKKPSC